MDTLSSISVTDYELPLSEVDQAVLRPAILHNLGSLPFEPGALISRSLWVIFIGEWGIWTHATLPVDDRLDIPDEESIGGLCGLIGSLIRPGPAKISEADAYIFNLVRQAAVGRETAPWSFYVVGPYGIQEITEEAAQGGEDGRQSGDASIPTS